MKRIQAKMLEVVNHWVNGLVHEGKIEEKFAITLDDITKLTRKLVRTITDTINENI